MLVGEIAEHSVKALFGGLEKILEQQLAIFMRFVDFDLNLISDLLQ